MTAFTVTIKAGLKKEKARKRSPKQETPKPPSRVARQLALAYLVERFVEQGKIKNYADASRRLGITRARMSQVMNLLTLPAETQNAILIGQLETPERDLRPLLGCAIWPGSELLTCTSHIVTGSVAHGASGRRAYVGSQPIS